MTYFFFFGIFCFFCLFDYLFLFFNFWDMGIGISKIGKAYTWSYMCLLPKILFPCGLFRLSFTLVFFLTVKSLSGSTNPWFSLLTFWCKSLSLRGPSSLPVVHPSSLEANIFWVRILILLSTLFCWPMNIFISSRIEFHSFILTTFFSLISGLTVRMTVLMISFFFSLCPFSISVSSIMLNTR